MQSAISGDLSSAFSPGTLEDSIAERIRQILSKGNQVQSSVQWAAELPPLIRHYLLRESSRSSREMHLRVPTRGAWPSIVDWGRHGIQALTMGEDLLLTAKPWRPDWLDGSDQGVFADAFAEKNSRVNEVCDADPFVTDATGYKTYSCPGQREAVRAAFLMRPGDTLIVNLPTGSGKSLVGQAPALVYQQEGHLTLFVVPTVALAIDQGRQMRLYLERKFPSVWPLAWYGGTSTEDRTEIRKRLRDGTQRILFTSPEALTTSLLSTIVEVARAGMLRYLVIDEAHLVAQWGDEFRPAFQALAGVRNALLRLAPGDRFRTLLLSATLTEETVEMVANLFGPPERVQMVSAVHLRPEPQYWFYQASSRQEKFNRVLEALRFAPRPFILYVTTRSDARQWLKTLQDEVGLRRIACFEGATPDSDRERIISDWIANRLDGVVATSAFGVGIDKSDIRTIIHATIPETLDRYYQEVGRGGRDGIPSISLLVADDMDWALPERLARPAIITSELGINRWRALYDARGVAEPTDLIRVNLETVPKHVGGTNEFNVDWNMRTLLLMCRAGLMELDIEANEGSSLSGQEFAVSTPLSAMAAVRVRILDHGHLLPEVWERRVGPARARTSQGSVRNFGLLKSILKDHREVSEALARLYRIDSSRWSVDVTRVCGGCPIDRGSVHLSPGYHAPSAAPIHRIPEADMTRWFQRFPWLDPTPVYVFVEDDMKTSTVHQSIIRFLGWLVSECDVREIVTNTHSAITRLPNWRTLYRQSRDGILLHREIEQLDEEPYSPLSRVSVIENSIAKEALERIINLQRPFHLIVLSSSTPDPANPRRLLQQIARNTVNLNQVIAVLNQ